MYNNRFTLQDYKCLLLNYLIKNIRDMSCALKITRLKSDKFLHVYAVNQYIAIYTILNNNPCPGVDKYLLRSILPSLLGTFFKEKDYAWLMKRLTRIINQFQTAANTGATASSLSDFLYGAFLRSFQLNSSEMEQARRHIEACFYHLNGGTKLPLLKELVAYI